MRRMRRRPKAGLLGRIYSLDEVARFVVFPAATQNSSSQICPLDSHIAPRP